MLGVDVSTSSTSTASAVNHSASVASTLSSDVLQLILAKLESMQRRLSSLEKLPMPTTSSATSKEAVTPDISSDQEGDQDRLWEHHRTHCLPVEEEHASLHEGST